MTPAPPRLVGDLFFAPAPSCTRVRGREILRTSPRNSALGVGLPLDHRFGRLRSSYEVCMPMHDIPLTVFGAKNHRRAQSKRGYILPPILASACSSFGGSSRSRRIS